MEGRQLLISTFLMNSPDRRLYQLASNTPTKTPGNIDLQEAIELATRSPMWAARGEAVQAYAALEQSLCSLFQYLSSMELGAANIVFYKITNYRARNDIIDKLLRKKHDTIYSIFWNSYKKQLQQLDLARNDIIHWLAAANVALADNGHLIVGINLIPAQSLSDRSPGTYKTIIDVQEFIEKCLIWARLCNLFSGFLSRPETLGTEISWSQVFLQEVIYPLPPEHPLSQKPPPPSEPTPES